jgi:hypothetical protein
MDEKQNGPTVTTIPVDDQHVKTKSGVLIDIHHADDALLAELGYKSEFKVR